MTTKELIDLPAGTKVFAYDGTMLVRTKDSVDVDWFKGLYFVVNTGGLIHASDLYGKVSRAN